MDRGATRESMDTAGGSQFENIECVCARTQSILRYHHSHVRGGWRQHHVPHFHAYYQDEVGIFSVDPVEIIAGS